ncbi:MAG: DMT family transporter [Bacteriovoracaceae bacterium]
MKTKGIFFILLSGIGYGFLGIFGKFLLQDGVALGPALAIRFSIASILMWIYLLAFKKSELKKISQKEILLCMGLGILGYATFSSLYFLALEGLSASMTVLLLYTYPTMVVVLSILILKEKLAIAQKWALPISFLGIVLLIGGNYSITSGKSLLYGFLCAFVYALYILFSSEKLKKIEPTVSVAIIQSSAALILLLLHIHTQETLFFTLRHGFVYILGLSLVVTILPMITFAQGIKYLTASEVSLLYTVEPLAAILLATLLFGEKMEVTQLFGGAFVLISLYLCSFRKVVLKSSVQK